MKQGSSKNRDVTIIDVAREAGVSYATVSRVVNGKDYVKPDKRERVLLAMTQLGYVANQQARSLVGGRSQVIGLLVPDLGSSYFGEILRGIDQALHTLNYDMLLYTTHRRRVKESEYVTAISRGLAAGLLLIAPSNPALYLSTLEERGFPYILIDHTGIDRMGPAVGVTNRQGAYQATRYLIELGHQRIGFILGRPELPASTDRLAGYQAALIGAGLPVVEELICQGDFNQPSGYSCASGLLANDKPPTAIFASNDLMAFGVMEAVRDQGLRIGHDVSVIGFDDIPQAANVHPQLTTVRQPLVEMGRKAAQMLVQHIEASSCPSGRIQLETELIIRHSCLPLRTR